MLLVETLKMKSGLSNDRACTFAGQLFVGMFVCGLQWIEEIGRKMEKNSWSKNGHFTRDGGWRWSKNGENVKKTNMTNLCPFFITKQDPSMGAWLENVMLVKNWQEGEISPKF